MQVEGAVEFMGGIRTRDPWLRKPVPFHWATMYALLG